MLTRHVFPRLDVDHCGEGFGERFDRLGAQPTTPPVDLDRDRRHRQASGLGGDVGGRLADPGRGEVKRKLCGLGWRVDRRVRSGIAEKGQQIDQLLLERRLGRLRPVGRRGVPLVHDDPLVVDLLLTEFGLSGLVNRLEAVQDVVDPGLPGRLVGSWQVQPLRQGSLHRRERGGLAVRVPDSRPVRAYPREYRTLAIEGCLGRWFAAMRDLSAPPPNLLRHYVFARAEPLEPGLALAADPLIGGIPEQAEHGRVQDYGELAGQILGVLVGQVHTEPPVRGVESVEPRVEQAEEQRGLPA